MQRAASTAAPKDKLEQAHLAVLGAVATLAVRPLTMLSSA